MRCSIKELLRGDGVLPFSCELDPAELEFPSILRYESPLTAKGTIRSSAGLLTLTGETRVSLRCICDRCGREYDREAVEKLDTVLVTEHQDEEDPDVLRSSRPHSFWGWTARRSAVPTARGFAPAAGTTSTMGPVPAGRKQIPHSLS